jgi:hypothetical protein
MSTLCSRKARGCTAWHAFLQDYRRGLHGQGPASDAWNNLDAETQAGYATQALTMESDKANSFKPKPAPTTTRPLVHWVCSSTLWMGMGEAQVAPAS